MNRLARWFWKQPAAAPQAQARSEAQAPSFTISYSPEMIAQLANALNGHLIAANRALISRNRMLEEALRKAQGGETVR